MNTSNRIEPESAEALARTLAVIGGKWTVEIVSALLAVRAATEYLFRVEGTVCRTSFGARMYGRSIVASVRADGYV